MNGKRLDNGKQMYFSRRMFYRFLLPSLLSSAGLSLGNIVDSLVIGSRMGESGLAAIGLIAPIYMIYNVFDLGIAIGGSVYYTRVLGEGKAGDGIRSFNQMLYLSLAASLSISVLGNLFLPQIMTILGTEPSDGALYEAAGNYAKILLTAAPLFFLQFLMYYYIRCDNNQKLAAIGFITGNTIDIILNFVFVIILDMGVKGAIFATVIGKAAAICIYLPHLFLPHTILALRLVKPDIRHDFHNFRCGFATSSQFIFQFLFLIIINHILMRIGGEAGLAVFNVVVNLSYVLYAVYDGAGSAIQPLAGTFYGERNYKAQKNTLRIGLRWGLAIGLVTALSAGALAARICMAFGLREEVIPLGIRAVRLFCLGALCGGYSIMMGYYYQAVKRVKLVFLINFLRTFAVYLTFSLFFKSFGIQAFWWTFPATEAAALILWLLWRRHENKRSSVQTEDLDESRIYNRVIEKKEDLSLLISETDAFCKRWSAGFTQKYYVNLTIEELCAAIFRNGLAGMENGYLELTLIAGEDATFELHIRDNASRYNPFDITTGRIGGEDGEGMNTIGILIVKNKTKEFFYRHYQGFNTITVRV